MAKKLAEDWFSCPGCGFNMPACGFNKSKSGPQGLQVQCRDCQRGNLPAIRQNKSARRKREGEAYLGRAAKYLSRFD